MFVNLVLAFSQAMFTGLLIFLGGVLLITPGFITDFAGLCCLIPSIREKLIQTLQRRYLKTNPSKVKFYSNSSRPSNYYQRTHKREIDPFAKKNENWSKHSTDSDVIDVESKRLK